MSYKKMLIVLAIAPVALFGLISLAYNWYGNMERSREDYGNLLIQATRRQRLRMEYYFNAATDGLDTATVMLGEEMRPEIINNLTMDEIDVHLIRMIKRHQSIYSSCVAFIDDWNDHGGKQLFRLAVKRSTGYHPADILDLSKSGFQNEQWFTSARDAGAGTWTEPYFYPEFKAWIFTYMLPLYVDGRFIGEFGVDWLVEHFNSEMNSHAKELGEGVFSVLINKNGDYLMHPNTGYIRDKVNMFANDLAGTDKAAIDRIRTLHKNREVGFARVKAESTGDEWLHTVIAPLRGSDWSLAIFLPEKNFLTPLRQQLLGQLMLMAGLMFLVMLAVVLGMRHLTRPLWEVTRSAEAVNAGRYEKMLGKYPFREFTTLGTAYNTMIDTIRQRTAIMKNGIADMDRMLSHVSRMASQLISTSEEMTRSSQQLSTGAINQESVFTEISSSIEELKTHADSNATLAQATNAKFSDVNSMASLGDTEMSNLSEAMDAIQQSSKSINAALKSIDSIAFQTNILALNAAVEAARAGSHGKGFSVVASEVRQLANRSADSVVSTSAILEANGASIETGVELGKRTADSFGRIGLIAKDAAEMMKQVADQARGQSLIVNEIQIGLEEAAKIARKNVKNASSHAAAAKQLSGLAHDMSHLLHANDGEGARLSNTTRKLIKADQE